MSLRPSTAGPLPFHQLRTELADLAFALERQGRRDAADIVMQIDARLCELAHEAPAGSASPTPASLTGLAVD